MGMIPVAYAPSSVKLDEADNVLVVANDKGVGTRYSFETDYGVTGYNTHQDNGTVGIVPVPGNSNLPAMTRQVFENNHWDLAQNIKSAAGGTPDAVPVAIPDKIGDPSLIQHVFLIIRENRTYDQILGDVAAGDGDPSLAVFGGKDTPNAHRLVKRFPLLDNFYDPSRQSADRYQWITEGLAPYADDIQSPDWVRIARDRDARLACSESVVAYPAHIIADPAARGKRMTPERYERVVDLFQQTLSRTGKTRHVFLAEACGDDDELRRQVEDMLAADEEATDFMAESPGDIAKEALQAYQQISLIGQTLGEYRVLARLGTGGMGDVFLAEDTRLRRKIALKLLPPAFASNSARLARFERKATPGLLLGTPRYMSPERARGLPVDCRTDLFSLGTVLYEMLAGTPAMQGATPSDTIASILTRDPARSSGLRKAGRPNLTCKPPSDFPSVPSNVDFFYAIPIACPKRSLARRISRKTVSHLPLDHAGNRSDTYWKEGAPVESQNTDMADLRRKLPRYFNAVGPSILSGRDFTESDDAAHEHVAIVDDVLAKALATRGCNREKAQCLGLSQGLPSVPARLVSVIVCVWKSVAPLNRDAAVSHDEPLSDLFAQALSKSRFASILATLLSGHCAFARMSCVYGVLSSSVAQCVRVKSAFAWRLEHIVPNRCECCSPLGLDLCCWDWWVESAVGSRSTVWKVAKPTISFVDLASI